MTRLLGTAVAVGLVAAVAAPAAVATTGSPLPPAPSVRSAPGHGPVAPDPGPAGSGLLSPYADHARYRTHDCETGRVGHRVLVIGDSVTVRARVALVTRLRVAGWSVCLDARSSQPTSAALDYYAAAAAFPATVDLIVMATGSNDIFAPSRMTSQVSRAKAYAGSRPVVWVDVWVRRWSAAPSLAAYDLINSRLVNSAVARQRVDVDGDDSAPVAAVSGWYAFLMSRPTRQAAYLLDGVHPNTAGAEAWAALVVTAVRSRTFLTGARVLAPPAPSPPPARPAPLAVHRVVARSPRLPGDVRGREGRPRASVGG